MNEHLHHRESMGLGCKRISWSAILIGAIVAVGLGFLLNMFCLAIGLSAFTLDDQGKTVVAVGGWWHY